MVIVRLVLNGIELSISLCSFEFQSNHLRRRICLSLRVFLFTSILRIIPLAQYKRLDECRMRVSSLKKTGIITKVTFYWNQFHCGTVHIINPIN